MPVKTVQMRLMGDVRRTGAGAYGMPTLISVYRTVSSCPVHCLRMIELTDLHEVQL